MRRNAGDYVKSWGAALIRGAASNPEFTVLPNYWKIIISMTTLVSMSLDLVLIWIPSIIVAWSNSMPIA